MEILNMLWPIFLLVFSSTFYNLSTKVMPKDVQPLASLTISYAVATIISFIAFFITSDNKNILMEIKNANWTSVVLGCSIVAVELAYIFIYRSGWKMGVGTLIGNVGVTCVLLILGFLVFKEHLSIKQAIGIITCLCGMFLCCLD